jgi:hypothetical protein
MRQTAPRASWKPLRALHRRLPLALDPDCLICTFAVTQSMDRCGCLAAVRTGAPRHSGRASRTILARAAGEARHEADWMTIPSLSFASPGACIAGLAGSTACVPLLSHRARCCSSRLRRQAPRCDHVRSEGEAERRDLAPMSILPASLPAGTKGLRAGSPRSKRRGILFISARRNRGRVPAFEWRKWIRTNMGCRAFPRRGVLAGLWNTRPAPGAIDHAA